MDNFGPLWIPKAGEIVTLSLENIAIFRRLITVYEGHTLKIEGKKFIIDGKETTTYTIQQNYYFMMGDNRHNSEDSRVWGFVPEDHVVGKPLFIWFSRKDGVGIRWERLFKSANVM
jgi:signal peptidase I